MPEIKRPLKVFIFHAPVDKIAARDLYLRLINDGVDAWLVKEKLLPGQDWMHEIHQAVYEADIVIGCLSGQFRQGEFRKKEVQIAFEAVLEQLDDEHVVITARLEECDPPAQLEKWLSVDVFEKAGYEKLMHALRAHAERIGAAIEIRGSSLPQISIHDVKDEQPVPEEKPVEAVPGILQIIEGAGILIEDPAVQMHKPERGIFLALFGFVAIIMMALFGPAWIEQSIPATSTPTLKLTRTAAPPKEVTPNLSFQLRPIPTLVSQGKVSHIVFLVDTSGSMNGQRIRMVRSAVSEFIARLGDGYLFSVIEFDTNVELRIGSTRDSAAASDAIQSIIVDVDHNGTCIQDALYAGVQQASLFPAADESETMIILATDLTMGDHAGWDCHMPPLEDMASFILNQPMALYYIYVGDDMDPSFFSLLMTREGAVLVPTNEKETEAVLNEISRATGLGLPPESVPPTQTTEAKDVSMAFVPGGQFIMGSNPVSINSFWIDKTEVTNGMYARCVEAGMCSQPRSTRSHTRERYYENSAFENYPVIYVSWQDASDYCAWIGGRLPTEAEWEKAARGTDGRQFPWGDNDPSGVEGLLNYRGQDTTEVRAYPAGASPYEVLDMAGNASEWVADWFSLDYYNNPPYRNPLGPATGEYRVWRGGSWATTLTDLVRTTSRTGNFPTDASGGIGFRCARDASP